MVAARDFFANMCCADSIDGFAVPFADDELVALRVDDFSDDAFVFTDEDLLRLVESIMRSLTDDEFFSLYDAGLISFIDGELLMRLGDHFRFVSDDFFELVEFERTRRICERRLNRRSGRDLADTLFGYESIGLDVENIFGCPRSELFHYIVDHIDAPAVDDVYEALCVHVGEERVYEKAFEIVCTHFTDEELMYRITENRFWEAALKYHLETVPHK